MQSQLSIDEAYLILNEIKTRAEMRNFTLIDDSFERQTNFIRDPSRKKAALCTRRAGKTEGLARGLVETCIKNEGVAVLYIGLTRDSCRRIFWKAALKPLLSRNRDRISYKPNETRLEVNFGNGSVLYCLGMDATQEEMEKLLGGKYKLVVIDEAGSFRVDLEKMIDEMLWPALADLEGAVWLAGTPVDFTNSYFYKVTHHEKKPREPGWSVHEWSGKENPYMQKRWDEELEAILKHRPRFMETPAFKRMWLGIWVIDSTKLVYKYMRDRNWIQDLPGAHSEYTYGLGIDLGFNDESTFVLSAYSNKSRRLHLMKPWKQSGMDITAVANKIKEYQKKYEIYSMVIDGSNKQAVEEMRRRHSLPSLEAADKTGKAEFIDLFNSDLIQGDIVLVGPETSIIEDEWANLIWDSDAKGKKVEHPGCDNHLADAALYIWRKQYQYLYRPPDDREVKTDEEIVEQWADEQSAFLKINEAKEFWEREYG